jgi:TRAP-type transport system periplasmic protein
MKRLSLIIWTITLVFSLIILPLLTSCSSNTSSPSATSKPATNPGSASSTAAAPIDKSKSIAIKAVTFLPVGDSGLSNFDGFRKEIEKRSNGRITIDYRGGPEAIPPPQLGTALRDGVTDFAVLLGGHYEALGVPDFLPMSQLSIEQEKKGSDFYNLMQEYHQKAGLFYLGRIDAVPTGFFYLATKAKVEKPQDLTGKKIEGVGTIHNYTSQAFGGIPLSIKDEELYSALERGTADAWQGSLFTLVNRRFYEVLKYLIDAPYLNATGAVVLNLKTWNQIPGDLQDLIMQVWTEQTVIKENARSAQYDDYKKNLLPKSGMTIVRFSDSETASFVKTAWEAEWKRHAEKYPDITPKFKSILAK